MFQVFVYHLQASQTIADLVGGPNQIVPDLTPTLADSYLTGPKKSCIGIVRSNEKSLLHQQGFKTQHRIKVEFGYDVMVYSKVGAAYCAEIGAALKSYLDSNERVISVNFGGTIYNLYIDPFECVPSWNDSNLSWQEQTKISGFGWTRII